jgi:hypothetical protein
MVIKLKSTKEMGGKGGWAISCQVQSFTCTFEVAPISRAGHVWYKDGQFNIDQLQKKVLEYWTSKNIRILCIIVQTFLFWYADTVLNLGKSIGLKMYQEQSGANWKASCQEKEPILDTVIMQSWDGTGTMII